MSQNSSNYYQLYIENVLQLAETIVVKSAAAAEGLNRWVSDYHGASAVDTLDPRSWKYYLNISGQYHVLDTPMTVVSLDTLQEIVFSQENLQIHRATLRGYAYGTREYRQLVSRYPSQEMLILGILYPVDIDRAIAAADFTILSYPPALVEANEYSLVANLQKWIDGYKVRWMNNQYAISDDLYPATAMGVLYLNLVPAILNLRLQACKTNEAHSYHVRQYLASHGMLDVYLDNLTIRQALFLYRNIAYIERNSGQRNVFEWLVEHIMTERHLPLAEYVMRHDLTKQPTEIYPALVFQRKPITPVQSNDGLDIATLDTLLSKEDPLALANAQERVERQALIQEQFENSPANVVLTKALESSMIDYSNATPYTLEDILVNHWLWLSSNGYYYQAVVAVTNPKTGERLPMMVKDAFVFMWYAFCASVGIRLQTIPKIYAKRVQRIPTPTVDQMLRVATSLVPRSFAQQAHDWQPAITPMISTEAFYQKCSEIYQAANWQRKLIATVEHQERRGQAMNVVEQLYSDNICQLASDGYTYDAWFADRNIHIDDFTQDELGVAYLSITKDATGLSLHNTNSLKNLQRAMVSLLGQLSSYSVQFLTHINSTDIRVGDGAAVRVGNMVGEIHDEERVHALVVEPLDVHAKFSREAAFAVGGAGPGSQRSVTLFDQAQLQLDVKPHRPPGAAQVYHYRFNAAPVYVNPVTQAGPSEQGVIAVMGVDTIYPLTAVQRDELRDVWRLWNVTPYIATDLAVALGSIYLPGFDWAHVNLAAVLTTTALNGFDWIAPPPSNLVAPSISGTGTWGSVLTANPGTWSSVGALSYSYQWQANGVNLEAATASTYTIPADGSQAGQNITVVVTAAAGGQSTPASSSAVQVAPPPVANTGSFSVPAGQRITTWHHPTNSFNVPYVSYDNTVVRFLLHPGPNLEVPLVHFDNTVGAGTYTATVGCYGDSQLDSNYYQVVKNGVEILGTVHQGQLLSFTTTLALYDYLEFQLVGTQYGGGGDYLTVSISDGATTWDAQAAFWANLGTQSDMWKYFYRSRTGDPAGATNSAGPMQPVYGPL